MSQNVSSRRQELLSRLKTTLAIVSQATGFDNERPAGDAPHQWSSVRDPRLRKQEISGEGPGTTDLGGSRGSEAVPSSSGSSGVPSSTLLRRKFDEIQDEDEFLYGSGASASSSRQPVPDSSQDKRPGDQQSTHLQWAAQKQAREEEPRWTAPAESRQPSYGDRPQAVGQHSGDSRWIGNTDSTTTMIGQTYNQSQWMPPTPERGDSRSWGGSAQTMRYSDSDQYQSMGRGPQMAPASVGMQPDPVATKLQSLRYSDIDNHQSMGRGPQSASGNVGMQSDSVASKLQSLRYSDVEDRQSTGRGQQMAPGGVGMQPESTAGKLQGINAGMLEGILKLVASGTPQSASQQLQPQLPPQQQQPSFDSRQMYGTGYPAQGMYGQPVDRYGYISSEGPRDMTSGAMMYGQQLPPQHRSYEYSQPAAPQHAGTDMNPLLSQLTTALLGSNPVQTSSPPVTDHLQRLMEQVGSRSQAMSFRPVATGVDTGNQQVDRSVTSGTPSQAGIPPEKLRASTPSQYPVAGPAVAMQPDTAVKMEPVAFKSEAAVKSESVVSKAETTVKSEPAKDEAGVQQSNIDKDTLSRLLNMIGCGSNVTLLMKELIKKDGQKKEQTPTPEVSEKQDLTPLQPQAADQPQKMDDDGLKPITSTVPQIPLEAVDKPDSGENVDKEEASLLPETPEEPDAEEPISTVALSSLSRLQKNYDSPDDGSDAASKVAEDDEWKRSTEEFLHRLHSKSSAAPAQKEKSRSTSHDRSMKDKPKTKTTDGKKDKAEKEAKKAKDKQQNAGREVSAAEIEKERSDLLRGKREIEGALELLRKELTNLRTNKKRLLESPAGGERDEELSDSIMNERKLMDHMSQLNSAMSELNEHLEKLSSTKV